MSNPKLPSSWPRWLLRIIFTVLLVVIVIAGITLVTLPVFSNVSWVKKSLLDKLEDTAGGPIHLDHLEVHLLPYPRVILTGFAFASESPSPITVRAQKITLAFGWESLWQHHLVLTQGDIQAPDVTVHLPQVPEPEEPASKTFPDIMELTIHDGRLHLVKESDRELSSTWTWESIELSLEGMEPDGEASFELTAKSGKTDDISSLALKGNLVVKDQPDIRPDQSFLPGIPPITAKGYLKLNQANLRQMLSFFSDEPQESTQTRLSVEGAYDLALNPRNGELSVTNLQVYLDKWKFTGRGHLTGLHTESPHLHISGSTQSIGIEQLRTLLPPAWVPEDVQTFLKDRKADGTIQLLTGAVQGTINGPAPLRVEGAVRLEQGRLLTATGHPSITRLSGTVAFNPDLIRIRNVQGTMSPFTFEAQEADLEIRKTSFVLSIPAFRITERDWTLSGEANLKQLDPHSPVLTISGSAPPISITRLIDVLPEPWIPDSIQTVMTERQVDGIVELVSASLRWPMNDENLLATEGVIRLTQGRILVDPVHPPLTQVSGSVAFNSQIARLLDVRGMVESSTLLVKEGTLELEDSGMTADIKGGGDISVHDLIQAMHRDPRTRTLADMLKGYRDGQGRIRVATHIQGPLSHPDQMQIHQGSLAVEQVNLDSKEDWLPVTNLTGQMTFDHHHMTIQTLRGQLGNSPIDITARGDFRNKIILSNLTVRSELAASDVMTLIPSLSKTFSTFGGSLGTILTLSGPLSSLSYRLHIDLTDWDLAKTAFILKPAQIPGTFEMIGNIGESKNVVITHGELSLPPFNLDIKGSLTLQDPPQIRMAFLTESGTGALLPEGMSLGDKRLGLSTLAVSLALQGETWDWTIWNIQGSVESTDRVRASGAGTSEPGRKVFRLTWMQQDVKAKAEFLVRNLLIERLFPLDSEPRFTGMLNFHTSMDMDLSPGEWVQRLSKGNGNLTLENGRILTSPVLSKLLSLLNLHSVLMGKVNILESGFPVERLMGTFVVEEGVLSSKDFALKSPVLALAAAGTYNIATDEIDAIATVSPFGAYSSLLKSIPLFGTLMEGERKGLTTALFEVKGRREDPHVTYLPFQSLTGGIMGLAKFPLDVLKNVLTLPVPKKENPAEGNFDK